MVPSTDHLRRDIEQKQTRKAGESVRFKVKAGGETRQGAGQGGRSGGCFAGRPRAKHQDSNNAVLTRATNLHKLGGWLNQTKAFLNSSIMVSNGIMVSLSIMDIKESNNDLR